MRKPQSGGGWHSIGYGIKSAGQVGPARFLKALASKNACKTCALGMGGQKGGMRNEAGRFPEVCKKSMQAMVADMRGKIAPEFFAKYSISQLQSLSPHELEMLGRLVDPVMAEPGDTHYQVVSWEAALAKISNALKQTDPERSFFYASGRSSNEAGFLLNLIARAFGCNHVNNCSFYCHQASGVGLKESIGQGTGTIDVEDFDKCDTVLVIGGNPASNHPRMMTALVELRRRGGKVIVINPVREVGLVRFRVPSRVGSLLLGSDIASLYLQPTIGGDIAVLAGMAKRVLERGAVDRSFVDLATEGYAELEQALNATNWAEIEEYSGLSKSEIEAAADLYIASDRAIFAWTMGITHHEHGVENVQWIANLALMRGMLGKEGAGLLPIRGHSNVQGMGTIGVTPQMSKTALERLSDLGVQAAAHAGHDTLAMLDAAAEDQMDFGICLGGNLWGASPDPAYVGAALGKLKMLAYLSTSLNTGHAHGLGQTTVILPVRARDEETQSTTQESMFSYVRLSNGGISRYDGPRGEVEVLAEIARQALGVVGKLDFGKLTDHEAIRGLIAKLVPSLSPIGDIGRSKKEFQIPDRVHHSPTFPTPNGRASFRPHPIPHPAPLGKRELRLMTVRSEGQFNTVVYEVEDVYRGQERRDIILMNRLDIERMDLQTDQRVTVRNETGEMRNILVREFEIKEGCALMYCPEANVLIPRRADPRSKTPAYKSIVVTIEA